MYNLFDSVPKKYKPEFCEKLLPLLYNNGKLAELHATGGFMKTVKSLYPEIDFIEVRDFYIYYVRLMRWISIIDGYIKVRNLYPNFKFLYDDSWDEYDGHNIGEEFKSLHGVVLPIDDPLWKTYIPPNFFGDHSRIQNCDDEPTHFDKGKLPVIDFEYDIDYIEICINR